MRSLAKYFRDPGRIARKLRWLRIYHGPPREVTVDSWNGRLSFHSRDWFIGKALFVDRAYEREAITNAIGALERGGWIARDARGVLVDIGANIGMITSAVLTRGWFGRAVCIEPTPANVLLLRTNMEQNGLGSRVATIGVALSSRPGELALELSEKNTGDNRLRAPGTPSAGGGAYREDQRPEIRVKVDTLDHALAQAGVAAKDVRLIWMDIQGHEGKCLEGAGATLEAGMPVVTEFWPYGILRSGTTRAGYMTILAAHFTRAYRVLDDQVTPMSIAEVDALFDELHRPNKMAQLIYVKEKR